MRYCQVPVVPPRPVSQRLSPLRERLIATNSKKWVNGTTLKYYLEPADALQHQFVEDGISIVRGIGIGINFVPTSYSSEAEIRISFAQNGQTWSYVGRDIIDAVTPGEPTMNFGWDLNLDPRGVDTVVHEVFHTLGFNHEHQNPFSGIVWSEQDVYEFFAGAPNYWDQQTTYHNVLRKLHPGEVTGTDWDVDSIMHYGFPAGLIVSPEQYKTQPLVPDDGLSTPDVLQALHFYPPQTEEPEPALLKVSECFRLRLDPGEQVNLRINPAATREYTIGTHGKSDVVMVLFEEHSWTDRGGNNHLDWQYIAGDDDSGLDYNARIQHKLFSGRNYELRVRLYSQYAQGETILLMV